MSIPFEILVGLLVTVKTVILIVGILALGYSAWTPRSKSE